MRMVRAFGGLLAALLLSACGDMQETYRYRLTVEVATPQGVRTGSSVVEVDLREAGENAPPDASGVDARLRGEAVAVSLPGDRVLFALLRTEVQADAAKYFPFQAITTPKLEGHEWGVRRARWLKDNQASGVLPPEHYPMLVTFRDPADPTSVEMVDPDNLAATFRPGTRLQRITVEMTDEEVTSGIEERLGWLPDQKAGMLDGRINNTIRAENRLANDLSRRDFTQGLLP